MTEYLVKTILFVSPTGTFDNGAEISIFNLMKHLSTSGYKIINVAPKLSSSKRKNYEKQFGETGIVCYFLPYLKWWWQDAPGNLFGSEKNRADSYRENIQRLMTIIRKENVDLVVTNSVNVFQGSVAAQLEGIPHYWLIHEFPEGEFEYYKEKLDFIKMFSTKVFSVTGALNEELTNLMVDYSVDSFIPYNDVNTAEVNAGVDKRLVSIGRLTPRKNQLELIKAFQNIDKNTIELVFIGPWDEAYKKECDDYIQKYEVRNVSFIGEAADPWSLVTQKDICVLTSHTETYGLVYVEAVLNGIPVIFSDNRGFTSAYHLFQTGDRYHLGNIDELKKKINQSLINFETLKKDAIQKSEEAAAKYTISSCYYQIIKSIETEKNEKKYPLEHIANVVNIGQQSRVLTFMRHINWLFLKFKVLLKTKR